ncbi:MAG: 4Fe-4S dicluster domain-containing protein, partial [Phycisphaerales bacterium]
MPRSIRSAMRPATDLPSRNPSGHPVARRTVLGLLVGAVSSSIWRFTSRQASRPLRPPGAVDEQILVWLCTRCGNCVRSCPYDVIRRETGRHSIAGILTPVLNFGEDYCREDCTRCTQVCPSGALTDVDPIEKPRMHIGVAQVDMDLCLLGEDRECSACMRW